MSGNTEPNFLVSSLEPNVEETNMNNDKEEEVVKYPKVSEKK